MKIVSYKRAGVDLDFANGIISQIRAWVRTTRRPEVLEDIGPFAALFKLKRYRNPVLVASADGVGTKLSMALRANQLEGIGIDLVAMNVNDVLAMGAEPLFFLDYVGLGHDQKKLLPILIRSMAEGCRRAGCALVGGETAEMPGTYRGMRLGLSGFAVGIVERKKVVDGSAIKAGDVVLGLASNGLHANGFSLVNKLFRPSRRLLTPTRIYVASVLPILRKFPVHGLAHITGGGLIDNIGRILPKHLGARIRRSWPIPAIFNEIQRRSRISWREMFHAFNMGIGFVVVLPSQHAARAVSLLRGKERVFRIGLIAKGNGEVIIE